MTDIARLGISVESDTTTVAAQRLDKLSASAGGAEGAARGVGSAFDSMAAPLKGATTGLSAVQQRIVGMIPALDGVSASARDSALAFQEIDASKAAFDRLRMSLDPLYASSMQYAAAADAVEDALARGAVTQGQASHVLGLAEKRYLGAAAAADRLSDQAVITGRQIKTATGVTKAGFSSMATPMRGVVQQLSQVAQQGQATGNYLQALAIQGADIGMAFGTFGIIAGVAAGALLPLIGNLVQGANAGRDLEDVLDDLSAASDRYSRAARAKRDAVDLITEGYYEQAIVLNDLIDLEIEMAQFEAAKAMRDSVAALTDQFGDLGAVSEESFERIANAGDMIRATFAQLQRAQAEGDVARQEALQKQIIALGQLPKMVSNVADQFGVTRKEAEGLLVAVREFQTAKGFQEQAREAQELAAQLRASYDSLSDMPPDVRDLYNYLLQAGIQSADLARTSKEITFETATSSAKSLKDQLREAFQYAAGIAQALADNAVYANRVGMGRGGDPRDFGGAARDWQTNNPGVQLAYAPGGSAGIPLPKIPGAGGGGGGSTDPREREAERIMREVEQYTLDAMDATQRYKRELADLQELERAGYLTAEQYARAREMVTAQFEEAANSEFLQGMQDGVQGFTDALFEGGDAVKDWARQTVAEIAKVIVQMMILRALGLPTDGVGGGSFAGWIGQAIFGGFRASGGPVSAGKAYMVGERGPEMIVPNAAGTVVPNDKLGRGNMTFNIDARGAEKGVGEEIAMSLRAEMRRLRADTPEIAIAAVRSDTRENPL
ncbi:hypothetical protein [uncultured Mameliella sp.]|uniref:hypothetical protein n=1 Tax=uncultured Mameliella sp. TaxID=1447087 RepID=UPI0026251B54|nr:hypothetical protein [uncultured Mameliella sp.]